MATVIPGFGSRLHMGIRSECMPRPRPPCRFCAPEEEGLHTQVNKKCWLDIVETTGARWPTTWAVCEGDEEQMNNSYERREHRAHRTGRLCRPTEEDYYCSNWTNDGKRGVSRLIPLCTDKWWQCVDIICHKLSYRNFYWANREGVVLLLLSQQSAGTLKNWCQFQKLAVRIGFPGGGGTCVMSL